MLRNRVILALLTIGLFRSDVLAGDDDPLADADVGNWTVGQCIMAQFAMELTLRPDANNKNTTLDVKVSPKAVADADQKYCGNVTQNLNLHWHDQESNSTEHLLRNLTIKFGRSNFT